MSSTILATNRVTMAIDHIEGDSVSGKLVQKDPPNEKHQDSTSLRFVNVTATSLLQRRSGHETEEARLVRAHVMRDYLRHRGDRPKIHKQQSGSSKISDHTSRFRLSPRERKPRRAPQLDTEQDTSLACSSMQRSRKLMPKITLNEAVSNVSDEYTLPAGLATSLPIDTSTPGTMTLLEYYHTSFWDNSLAVNPEGRWLSVAISDSAILHATLCLVALHRYQMHGQPLHNSYYWHRGEAMRLVSARLTDSEQAASDTTIGAVAILSTSDNAMTWPSDIQESHMKGLLTLVKLRGGIDALSTNRAIKRVVAWADILHATAHNTLPQLGTSKCTTQRDTKPLINLVKRHGFSKVNSKAGDDLIPVALRETFYNLQILSKSKSMLLHSNAGNLSVLRPTFSSLLYKTERSLLELDDGELFQDAWLVQRDDFPQQEEPLDVQAAKAAILIYTFHGLRDLAITAAFFDKLVSRLRASLESFLERLASQKWLRLSKGGEVGNSLPRQISQQHLCFLLWLCLNGWKVSALDRRRDHQEWFVARASDLCEIADVTSFDELSSGMRRLVFLEDYGASGVKDFLNEIVAHGEERK